MGSRPNPEQLLIFGLNPSHRNAQPGWAVIEKGRDLKHSSFVSWPTRAQADKALREVRASYPERQWKLVRVRRDRNSRRNAGGEPRLWVVVKHSSGEGYVVRDGYQREPGGSVWIPRPYTDAKQLGVYKRKADADARAASMNRAEGITNPRAGGFGNHKPGCPCAFCKRAAKLQSGELQPPALPNARRRRRANPSAEYERALAKHEEARKKFAAVRAQYRSRQVGDDAYLAARRAFDAATREFDAAYAKEAKQNPGACGRRWRKPAGSITDRALRYRANSPGCRPQGRRVCAFCGSRRNVEVHHLDGHEETTAPENLAWACRACNTTIGRKMQGAGLGRLTSQYNPSEGAHTLAQWVTAVLAMKGQNDAMTVPAAVKMIRATPAAARSRFAEQIWKRRRRPARRNPDETQQAVQLYQTFHGKDPRGVVEKQEPAIMREDYTAIGPLEHLVIKSPLAQTYKVEFEGDGVILASSPDGRQLYCIGGNQNLAGVLDADSLQKDLIDLGECIEVQYLARKVHTNFEPVSWHHSFGEKSGERPELIYDKLKRRIFFAGGAYYIDTSAEISPGIEN